MNRVEVVDGMSVCSHTQGSYRKVAVQSWYLAEDLINKIPAWQHFSVVPSRAKVASSIHLKRLTFSIRLAISCREGPAMGLCFASPHFSFAELGSKPFSKADRHMAHPGTAANDRQETSRHLNIEQPCSVRGKSSAGASRLP